ncbi:MAG: maleylpyruvate isomerase N-terminal domain-containing protein, partial [Candidatus Nanopelagicales bacterium]
MLTGRSTVSDSIWPTIHAERRALADDLAGLTPQQWETPSLCDEWNVHQVLAHQL